MPAKLETKRTTQSALCKNIPSHQRSMSTSIGLISDIHATAGPLRQALTIFSRHSVDMILCVGDIAGYGNELRLCIDLLTDTNCTTILGNHDVWYSERHAGIMELQLAVFFNNCPTVWQKTIEDKRLYAVHASPPDSMKRGISLLDQDGELTASEMDRWQFELEHQPFDIIVVGHTHQVYSEYLGRILVINPGSTTFNNSCAILTLPEMRVQFFPLAGRTIRKSWHWGI